MNDQDENMPDPLEHMDQFIKAMTPAEEQMLNTITPDQLSRMKLHLSVSGSSEMENLPQTDAEIVEMLRQHRLALYMQIKGAYTAGKISRLPTTPLEFPLPVLFGDNIKTSMEANALKILKEQVQALLMMDDDELKDFVGIDLENLQDVIKCAQVVVMANSDDVFRELQLNSEDEDNYELPDRYVIELDSVELKHTHLNKEAVSKTKSGTVLTGNDMQDTADALRLLMASDDEIKKL